MSLPWTEERVETLKRLWLGGFSASQIAGELGGVSRNAVIGKVHRLKLVGRAKAAAPSAPKTRKPAVQRTHAPARPAIRGNTVLAASSAVEVETTFYSVPEEVVIPFSQRITIMELREHTCRWPMGDPQDADFRYCGMRKNETGKPYCEYHAAKAFQPMVDRRRERRIDS
jgi:GcrA cell cycle regulator